MQNLKQIVVVNKALNMPIGKLATQVAHASLMSLLSNVDLYNPEFDKIQLDWLTGIYKKIVVYVKSEEKLLSIYSKAAQKGIPCYIVKDEALTVFDEPTFTCVGLGPTIDEDFIGITDKLQLL